jgi:uncharacterized membrane protein YeaQ/YmgE (transglycosylase-associated protein family)
MLWALLIGLIVGIIAKFLMPGNDPGGIFVTMLLGIGGSLVAHWLGGAVGAYRPGEPVGLFASVLGAMLILAIYRLLIKRRA